MRFATFAPPLREAAIRPAGSPGSVGWRGGFARRYSERSNFRPQWFLTLVSLLAWFLLPGVFVSPANAHQLSDSFLILEVTNAQIIGHWDIAVKDLLHARGVDPLDQRSTDARAWDPEYEMKTAKVLSRLQIEIDGAPATIKPVDYSTELYNDGPYAAMYFEIALPKNPRLLQVQYHLFFDTDPSHRGLMRLQTNGKTMSAIFRPGQASQQFDLRNLTATERFFDFIRLGVWHIWTGIDHILFLLALLLPSVLRWSVGGWQASVSFRVTLFSVLKIVTAFTLAHSVTLRLAALKIVHLNSRLVETVIALSVAVAALNNIFAVFPDLGWVIAFVFGFIHGFGFANVLSDLGLERGNLAAPLIGFNTGVELGQLGVVAVFLPLAFKLRALPVYRVAVFKFGSLLITALAAVWAWERMFDLKLLPF